MTANMKKPGAGGRRVSEHVAGFRALYGKDKSSRLPANWRDRLPDAAGYYAQHVAKLGKPNSGGWSQGLCPFHDDRAPSFSVHMVSARGHFRCYGCGERGDMVTFHMKRTGLDFVSAVRDLLGVRA